MSRRRVLSRSVSGGMMGVVIGLLYGVALAFAAVEGDSDIRSGMPPVLVFVLSLAGWICTGILAGELSRQASTRAAANRVGLIAAAPVTVSSIAILFERSRYFTLLSALVFVVCDVAFGLVGAEIVWRHYHNSAKNASSRY